MANCTAEKPLLAVQKGKKYNPANLEGKRFDRRNYQGTELKIWEGERIYLTPTKKQIMIDVVNALKDGKENKSSYAPILLQILSAVGGTCHIATLADLFLMYCGHRADAADFLNAKKELEQLSLISTGTIAQGPRKNVQPLPVKSFDFIYITFFGSMVAYSTVSAGLTLMSTNKRAMNVPEVKATVQSANYICKLIKVGLLSNFRYRPLLSKVINKNGRRSRAFCTPMYELNLKGARTLYYNCRKTNGWQKAMLQELNRVNLVFGSKVPTIIIATEDMFMSTELFKALLKRKRIKANILFTDDETIAKAKGKNLLYTLSVQGNRIEKRSFT